MGGAGVQNGYRKDSNGTRSGFGGELFGGFCGLDSKWIEDRVGDLVIIHCRVRVG